MSEQIRENVTENENVESPNVEEASTSEVEVETPESTAGESVKQENGVEETQNRPENEQKPTRAEKRIKNLLEQNKKVSEELRRVTQPSNEEIKRYKGVEPLISQQELAEGIDPGDLERRIQERVVGTVQTILANKDQIEGFKRSVSDHISDLEETTKSIPELNEGSDNYDPDFEQAFLEVYQTANYSPNGAFVPNRKASDIANTLKRLKERAVIKETAKLSGKMAKQVGESAVVPQTTRGNEANYDADSAKEKALRSGRAEDWAEYLKKIM